MDGGLLSLFQKSQFYLGTVRWSQSPSGFLYPFGAPTSWVSQLSLSLSHSPSRSLPSSYLAVPWCSPNKVQHGCHTTSVKSVEIQLRCAALYLLVPIPAPPPRPHIHTHRHTHTDRHTHSHTHPLWAGPELIGMPRAGSRGVNGKRACSLRTPHPPSASVVCLMS